MNPTRRSVILAAAMMLGGCASGDSLEGERTVFNNPYAAPVIDRSGIGPQCEVDIGRDATCLGAVVAYDRRGRWARLENGQTVRLTRAQSRILRERADLIQQLRSQPLQPPPPQEPPVSPPQSALSTAGQDGDKP